MRSDDRRADPRGEEDPRALLLQPPHRFPRRQRLHGPALEVEPWRECPCENSERQAEIAGLNEFATLRVAATFDHLRALSEVATPGPWEAEAGGSEGYYIFGARGVDARHPQRRHRAAAVTWGSFEQDKADAAFIAAAVNQVRAVLHPDSRKAPR